MRRRTLISGFAAAAATAATATATATTPTAQAASKPAGAGARSDSQLALPPLTGEYPVGTRSLHLVDHSRVDPWAPTPRARELMVQLWYPARSADRFPRARYIGPRAAERLAAETALRLAVPVPPSAFWRLRTAARLDAPAAVPRAEPPRRGWPTVLFSPGDGLDRSSCTALVQDLASHGFAVVAVDHTYDAGEVEFPDGRVVTRTVPPGADDVVTLVRTADIRFVVDQLTRLNEDGIRPGALDLSRLGMFGHSRGGTTTAEALLQDCRIRAGADIDGPVSDRVAAAGLRQAFLNLNSQIGGTARAKFERNLPRLWPRLSGWHLWLRLRDSGHLDFTDFGLFAAQLQAPPSATAGLLGPGDPHRALTVVSAYLAAFFTETLKHQPQRILRRPSADYPEMIFEDPR